VTELDIDAFIEQSEEYRSLDGLAAVNDALTKFMNSANRVFDDSI
jgi:hypothetical protein